MTWKADTIQGVLFLATAHKQVDALDIWKLVSGESSPESYQRPGLSPVAQSVASGTIGDFLVNIGAQINRIDVFVNPLLNQEDFTAPPQFPEAIKPMRFVADTLKAIAKTQSVNRIALVSNFAIHVKTADEATSIIEKNTGVEFPEASTDLIYQYNTRKSYTAPGELIMNRLCTYMTGVKQMISGQLDISNMAMQQAFTPAVVTQIASFKIDINSATGNILGDNTGQMIEENLAETISLYEEANRRI